MFQLTTEESNFLRSQNVTLKLGRGRHRKYRPFAFTEQGVAMLSSVLRSQRAIQVNIEIMRAFVRRLLICANGLNGAKQYNNNFAHGELVEPLERWNGSVPHENCERSTQSPLRPAIVIESIEGIM